MSSHSRPPDTYWDSVLPGPPSRNNFGSLDLSPSGLLAFPAGASITIIDSLSLQLIVTIPLPPPSSSPKSLSPFITSLRWAPHPLPHSLHDLLPSSSFSSPLLLAAADRHGRIALFDVRSRGPPVLEFDTELAYSPKSGVQDLCWIRTKEDSYALAAISGPSLLSLFSASTGKCFWKYDASPEYFSCIRRDPFDWRHFCALGMKGFLLSAKVIGESEDGVAIRELQIMTDCTELVKLERDLVAGNTNPSSSSSSSSSSPASAFFSNYVVKLAFSPQWKHIVFATFPREFVVFDLQYETTLYSAALPRGCGKFLDVLPDPSRDLLYCAHLDGRLSIWKRKEYEFQCSP